MSTERRFTQVDVFASEPRTGNPLAVVLDGEGLTTEQMQDVARWTNLSETTFLLPPTDDAADYLVRIFTTTEELPFAGHPTLGTCFAWLAAGGVPADASVIRQQCGVGVVEVRASGDRVALAAPPLIRSGPLDDTERARIAMILQTPESAFIDAAWVDNGPGWAAVLLESAEAVRALEPIAADPSEVKVGVVGPCGADEAFDFEVRALFSTGGPVVEDPVTGSLNASVAQWLLESGRASAPYTATQGSQVGAAGRVEVTRDPDGTIWIAGRVDQVISGTIRI